MCLEKGLTSGVWREGCSCMCVFWRDIFYKLYTVLCFKLSRLKMNKLCKE